MVERPSSEHVVRWLANDFETLIAVERPFTIASIDDIRDLNVVDTLAHVPLLWVLQGVDGGKAYAKCVGQTVAFAIQGSREFRPPSAGPSGGLFSGIAVLSFAGGATAAVKCAEALRAHGVGEIQLQEINVAVLQSESVVDSLFLYVGDLGNGLLAIATAPELVVALLKKQAGDLPEPAGVRLKLFKSVDRNSAFWAVRAFDGDPCRDQTSPFYRGGGPLDSVPDDDAIGLALSFREGQRQQHVTYLTRNEQALDIAQRAWTYQRNGQPKLVASARRMPEDAVEITLPTPDVEAEEIFALLLLMRLGHALY